VKKKPRYWPVERRTLGDLYINFNWTETKNSLDQGGKRVRIGKGSGFGLIGNLGAIARSRSLGSITGNSRKTETGSKELITQLVGLGAPSNVKLACGEK